MVSYGVLWCLVVSYGVFCGVSYGVLWCLMVSLVVSYGVSCGVLWCLVVSYGASCYFYCILTYDAFLALLKATYKCLRVK